MPHICVNGSSLVQAMACRLFGAKPLPEPMLAYCQLDSWEHISVTFESGFYHFNSRKCNWKCRLPKMRPFSPGGRWVNLLLAKMFSVGSLHMDVRGRHSGSHNCRCIRPMKMVFQQHIQLLSLLLITAYGVVYAGMAYIDNNFEIIQQLWKCHSMEIFVECIFVILLIRTIIFTPLRIFVVTFLLVNSLRTSDASMC